jgi:copper(I)-binding protein
MMTRAAFLLLLFAAGIAQAQVEAHNAWMRGTVEGQNSTGAFMELTSPTDTNLVSASSPVAKTVEIHSMEMAPDGVMRMRALEHLAIPANKSVWLAPGGNHIMLTDLVRPLKAGESVPVVLTFEDPQRRRQTVEVKATVRALGAGADKPR